MKLVDTKRILDKTLSDARSLGNDAESLPDVDLYWMTPHGKKFDMTSSPGEYEVGNLAEEYESVMRRIESGEVIYPDSLLLLSTMLRLAYESAGD